MLCNPILSDYVNDVIGDSWIQDLNNLTKLKTLEDNEQVLRTLMRIKRENKIKFADYVEKHMNVKIDPNTMFDFQVKRIHEYKRQLLNCLHVIVLYNRLKSNPNLDICPRTVMIGGKAAPGYHMAKLIIKLFNQVALVINQDPVVQKKLKVGLLVFYKTQ